MRGPHHLGEYTSVLSELQARRDHDCRLTPDRALESLDVPTQLDVGPGELHQWNGLRHVLRKANIELEWFEKYANHRAYDWEKAPSS